MRAKRTGAKARFMAAIAAVLTVLGGAPASAAPDGTLEAPYESASGQGVQRSDVDGNMAAAASGGTSRATVVAAHQTTAAVASVVYTVRFRLERAAAASYDSDPEAPCCWYDPYAYVSLRATAQHSSCATCRGASPEWTTTAAESRDVTLTVRVANHAGGPVPPGTIRISLDLSAFTATNGSYGPTPGSWLQCGPGIPGFCRICPFSDECGGSFETNAEAVSAFAVGTLTGIDFELVPPRADNQLPIARFTSRCWDTSYNGQSRFACEFDAGASSDPDGQITDYNWSFGDGSPTENHWSPWPFTHGFNDANKSYVVTLTVVDNDGGIGTESLTLVGNQQPVATYTISCSGLDCTFDGRASSDPDGQIAGYSWVFGDGTTSQAGPVVIHRYPEGGQAGYATSLTVTDNRGGKATKHLIAYPNQLPVARFTVSCSGRDCAFDGRSSSDLHGMISTYSWNLGDGSGAQAGATVQHRYPAGTASYVVTLTVTDNRGAIDTESRIVVCARESKRAPTNCS